jgi:hypothetical protein
MYSTTVVRYIERRSRIGAACVSRIISKIIAIVENNKIIRHACVFAFSSFVCVFLVCAHFLKTREKSCSMFDVAFVLSLHQP